MPNRDLEVGVADFTATEGEAEFVNSGDNSGNASAPSHFNENFNIPVTGNLPSLGLGASTSLS